MARLPDEPVAPFGATRKSVTGLVPEARLVPGDTLVEGKYGVTEAQVDRWIDELSGKVAVRLDGWERLSDGDPILYGEGAYGGGGTPTPSDRDQFVTYARDLVHNAAASYLEAARHPERATVNDTSYAAVLWQRFTDGLADLAGWLDKRLTFPEAGDEPAPDAGGIAYSFPAPLVGDALRF